jgi:hypothetical protein
MKRSLVALSLAGLATTSCATAQRGPTDNFNFDGTLPAYPELEIDGWRNYAGGSEHDNAVQIRLG